MKIPKSVEKLVASFERLPGIGPKTAASAKKLLYTNYIINKEENDDSETESD